MNGVFLTGASGIEYFYTPYLFAGMRWHPDPANYAFACFNESDLWRVDYIGETATQRQGSTRDQCVNSDPLIAIRE